MPVTSIEHKGFTIKAAAFELVGERRFISSLIILRNAEPDQKLFDLPVTHHLFNSAEEALQSTLAHGRGIVLRPPAREAAPHRLGVHAYFNSPVLPRNTRYENTV